MIVSNIQDKDLLGVKFVDDVVSNKKVEDALVGSADKNTYIEILKKNSFINE